MDRGDADSERYSRNLGTIGTAGQLRLLKAKVAVIGAGGLGGQVVELLARQGIGALTVVDGDYFVRHNLNRQLLATEQTLGQNKALAAADRVALINPGVNVRAEPRFMDEANAVGICSGMDVIVDATDRFSSRRLTLRIAGELRIPLVYAAIAGFTGQVSTVIPGDLAIRQLIEGPQPFDKGVETQLGTPSATPAIAAALQTQEVVKLITGIGQTLSGKLLYFDLEYNLFEIVQL